MRYLTKGELLIMLGEYSNSFTTLLMNPESFNLPADICSLIHITKQKLDWTNSIDMDLPEIKQLAQLMEQLGIIPQTLIDELTSVPDRKDYDFYMITVRAQDDITIDNIYGAISDGSTWLVKVEFTNKTSGSTIIEDFRFTEIPSTDLINSVVANRISELKI